MAASYTVCTGLLAQPCDPHRPYQIIYALGPSYLISDRRPASVSTQTGPTYPKQPFRAPKRPLDGANGDSGAHVGNTVFTSTRQQKWPVVSGENRLQPRDVAASCTLGLSVHIGPRFVARSPDPCKTQQTVKMGDITVNNV